MRTTHHQLALFIVVVAGPARAGDRHELLHSAGDELGPYYKYVLALTASASHTDGLPSPDACDAAVRAWRSRGLKDDRPWPSRPTPSR